MKKKLLSFVTAAFVLLMCVFASACGDRYKDLEFKVYYAFSEDAKTWHDASKGISLNYAFEGEGSEDESLLVFDNYGATVYLKVEVKNVKAKYLDKITVSPTSTSGLDFSSVMVKNKQVFALPIVGNVNSSLKLCENNSGKKYEIPLEVSRKLEAIEADQSYKPAMPLTSDGEYSTLDLNALNNLTYQPVGLTNQIGVTYSIDSIGSYIEGEGGNEFYMVRDAEIAKEFVEIEDGILKIINGDFYDTDSYVIRVRATSVYYDGTVDGVDPIETVFDVYVVDSAVTLKTPKVKFDNGNLVEEINLYENGGEYATSTIMVDTTDLITGNLVYKDEVRTNDGIATYGVAVYVLDQSGKYVRCDFENQSGDGTVGINGLFVKKATVPDFDYAYTLSIASRDVLTNKIKIAYELEGFDYSHSQEVDASTEIEVLKDVVPTAIIVNDTTTMENGEHQYANVYSTTSAAYKGLQLKLAANPNNNIERKIEFEANSNLKITNALGQEVAWVYSGETIFIKFVGNEDAAVLNIKTLNSPEIYNGSEIETSEYLSVSYELTKLVTADAFEFVANSKGAALTGDALIDANQDDTIFVKVYYSGKALVSSTINLESSNSKVKFANGTQEMSLSDVPPANVISSTDKLGKYNLYEVSLKAVGSKETAQITISAGDESFAIGKTVNVSSVFVMPDDAEELNVDAQTVGVKEFSVSEVNNGSFNFAIAKGENAQFVVKDGNGDTKTISSISIQKYYIEDDAFSATMFEPMVVSNSVFDVVSYISGKTQVSKISVSYYVLDDDDTSSTYGQIITRTKIINVEIAVFDSVGSITKNLSNQSIGYVNSYYDEVSSSEVTFSSYTSGNGTPSESVVFTGGVDGGTIAISGASQIKVGFVDADYQTIKQTEGVEIYYVVNGERISLLTNNGTVFVDTKGTADEDDDTNILNGSFIVNLKKANTGLKDISLTLTALRFGIISNTSVAVKINVAEIDKAERIVVNGDFNETSGISKELQMSFMDVIDGGHDIAEFEADIEFKTQNVPQGMLRFDDVDTSLAYILYRYQLDENGNFKFDSNGNVKYSRINNDFFDISIVNGKVTIKASKVRGGGLFKLVLVTKDSYNQEEILDEASLEEVYFDTRYEFTIRVSDGTKNAAYIIDDVNDLQAINYNLDKHFILSANIGDDEPVNIRPLGVGEVGGSVVVKPFTGSLNGQFTTVVGENQEKTTSYSIRLHVETAVVSSEGYLAGLFAMLGENANIRNLKLDVSYASSFYSNDMNGLHVGSLAGINNGKIDNVHISIVQGNEAYVGFDCREGAINFGGIVGTNNGKISHIKSESYQPLQIKSNQYQTHNIGLIAGSNGDNGEIYGSYLGKESLNNYIYDVVANLVVMNTNELNDGEFVKYYIGAVAGANSGLISGLLVGGQIYMSTDKNLNVQSGAIGGIAGLTENGSNIYLSTALSLDITSTSSGVDVGGIVGKLNSATVDTVKYISAITKIDADEKLGVLSGKNNVGGIVGNATNGTIRYASVESFIETIDEGEIFYTIEDGVTVAGIACASGTNVENSFVSANIKGTQIYLTTNATENNSYFIGKTEGTVAVNITSYNINNEKLNDAVIDIESYMLDVSVSAETTDWKDIYYVGDEGNYVKATEFDATKTYKQFDAASWQAYAYSLVGLTEANETWIAEEGYNVVKVNGVEVFFSYLIRNWNHDNNEETANKTEPLMIVKPQSISAEINQDYVTEINSVYVKEFDCSKYESLVKETVVVNFFKNAGDEANAHYLFDDGTNNGLLNLSLLPEGAQGGYAYEIIGDGHNYAYINSRKQIVFTRVSNQTPILVRVYSAFNTEIELYVAFYSQTLLTNLTLNSSSIYYANEDDYDYQINVYTGQNNKVISLGAENILDGESYQDIFDVESLSQYLLVHKSVTETNHGAESKLVVDTNNSQSMTLRIRDDLSDDDRIGAGEYEIITLSLKLTSEYFGLYDGNNKYVEEDILIKDVKLKVNLYNSATAIDVDGTDAEITTADDISLTVTLTTQFIDKTLYNGTKSETLKVNSAGELYNEVADGDSIRIKFEILDGAAEAQALCQANGKSHFAELFVNNSTMFGILYESGEKTLGYQYSIILELEDKHTARYIENNIKFNIVVYASSTAEVNNESSPIEIVLKPSALQTIRMENYVVQSLKMHTDYTNIVTNKDIETSIIEPGGLGNVMMIYLEPSYSQVTSASIQTGALYVPSSGKTVQVKFTQLAYDRRASNGEFTTLSGGRGNSQVGDTLDLNLISEIDRNGNNIYNGIIIVRVHIEEPFVGLEASLKISINVTTKNNPEGITRTRDLLTSYLPGTEISYNEDRAISDGYLIQKGTSKNEVTIKIYGYQFNSNPDPEFIWELPKDEATNKYFIVKDGGYYRYVDEANKAVIYKDENNDEQWNDGETKYLTGDYVSYYLNKNINDIVYNNYDDSYTLKLMLNVAENIPAPFRLSAELYLATKDGQIKTSPKTANTLVFYPTEYIINSIKVAGLTESGRKNIAIGQTREIAFEFTTDSEINDLSEVIYNKLLEAYGYNGDKIAEKFTYYQGGTKTFANNHSEFEYSLVHDETNSRYIISITGLEKFNSLVKFEINYNYEFKNGEYVVTFGAGSLLSTTFTMNIISEYKVKETIIYSTDDIYNSKTGEWLLVEGGNYVLVNDIELEQVVPITTKIASFDGNNRVISIKSFKVDTEEMEFGLFANIGTYYVEDLETEEPIEHQTILKNMIVDYGKFEGTLALNNNVNPNVLFGGLVARNNGGLIYNCDVMNLSAGQDKEIDIIVASNANLTFGGLVGENKGIITNSRVGRASYTKITATPTTESAVERYAGGLTFKISNQEGNDDVNQFVIKAGGFVGENTGTIASSYVTNTNLINYSTNETTNITAGFVGRNSGTISYSYAKADDKTITTANPYATGYAIENLGNGIVSGFVYENLGTINNSYSNIELKTKSSYISGFVYNNAGTISESYAATTMNSGLLDSVAEQPFVGVDNKGELLSNGTLENTYYLMRSTTDNPYTDGNKDVAQALNEDNFQNSEYLVGYAFVLSNSKAEREQGIWSYYTTTNKKRILPELMNADSVSHSYRFVVEANQEKVLRNAVSYAEGTKNNPYTISNVEEFNKVFTGENGTDRELLGNVRFINNIDFNDDETAIQTRSNYTLGSSTSSTKTSVEGNGMTIDGIYLDVGDAVVNEIGLFAEIQNAYVKNLNLNFATPKTDGQFSTTTAMYSGGLAGRIENSAIININLDGENTTLTGSNFVGGVAGLISGNSLIYGIETNLNVKAGGTEGHLYYNKEDYEALNIKLSSHYDYPNYLKHLSYAGGVAGVLDLTKRSNIEYNVQFIDVRGDQMTAKTFDGKPEANILAEYAGGVAGYASRETKSFKLRYFMGSSESIRGDWAVGGLYGVSLGGIVASQVTADEDTQYNHDTAFGNYIKALNGLDANNAKLNTEQTGNLNLLEGYKYVGGLVGVGLDTTINSSYSKATIKSGKIVGGLVGLNVAGIINYSYAIPYVNYYEDLKYVGGLIGATYGIAPRTPERNSEIASYEALIRLKGINNKTTDIQFTYSSVIVDSNDLRFRLLTIGDEDNGIKPKATFDFICADYKDDNNTYLCSNNNSSLMYVYAGTVPYDSVEYNDVADEDASPHVKIRNNTNQTNKSLIIALHRLYNVGDPDQTIAFQEVFSGWALIKYWSLNEAKYFPLLNNKTVDNFIEIDHENDLAFIRTNPNGKFKVVESFEINPMEANWIISGKFTGVLVGELENDDRRPTITIKGLTPTQDNASTGFFEETYDATISNISFVWQTQENKPSINLSQVNHITMASGLTCKDVNSLISNVEVRTSHEATKDADGYIVSIDGESKTIAGFGGVVGQATYTNILGCNFVGKVKATLKNLVTDAIYVGGAVGYTTIEEENLDSATVINNVLVGDERENSDISSIKYPKTSFDLTINAATNKPVYIGGSVGKADNAAIATNNVGGMSYADGYKNIDISVKLSDYKDNLYLGGVVGYAENGLIASCESATNIKLTGTTSGERFLRVGGLAGEYNLGNPSTTTGISKCNVNTNISTYTDESDYLKTGENTQVMLSTGVARLYGGAILGKATLQQCLLTGEINTKDSDIQILYAGGAAAVVDSSENQTVDIEEVTTNSTLIVGTEEKEAAKPDSKVGTKQLYAGGLVGSADKLEISYSSSLGRITPITNKDADDIYVGGLIGVVKEKAQVNNSYALSSIIAGSITHSAIEKLNVSALVGSIPENSKKEDINFTNVFYSSDYALCTDENQVTEGEAENKIIEYLGKNLSATTMIRTGAWHNDLKTEEDKQYGIWKSDIGGKTILPYLAALEEAYIKFGILTKPTGQTAYNYVEGSAMRPIEIHSNSEYPFAQDKYNYYLLVLDEEKDLTPKFSNALNGILIGVDNKIENTFRLGELSQDTTENSYGIVSMVNEGSAISNLHVVVEREISVSSLSGIIAGVNHGVIFNCSVQGNGIKVSGIGGSLGLIAGKNNGLISHSFSTAEIISTKDANVEVAGIVHTNEAKLLSNYFTGYIESDNSAGIVFASSGGYIHNNYMAGVLTSIKTNAFHACAEIVGSNNFIDYYSDIKFKNKINAYNEEEPEELEKKNKAIKVLKPVDTLELMSKAGLKGDWYTTIEKGVIDTSKISFGLNYNYPIYRFNKYVTTDKTSLATNECKNQLKTGTGETDDKNKQFVDIRYKYVVSDTKINKDPEAEETYYDRAFKIPHLGVLKTIEGLLNDSRNYVLIYDIDGQYDKNAYEAWTAVKKFNGVFVSNKYYAYNTPQTLKDLYDLEVNNEYCEIKNLSGEGLFEDVSDKTAYIGNLKLGSFYNLKNSGALGTTVNGTVVIKNVEFVENSKITGLSYYGALFGKVLGNLGVENVTTGSVNKANVRLIGPNDATAGLFAGYLSGNLVFINSGAQHYAWLNGNQYAGGVVGEIAGGTIVGSDNKINIVKTNKSGEDVDNVTGVLGGIAGKGFTSTGGDAENPAGIIGLSVVLKGGEIKANAFGGAIGEVTDVVQIEDFTISSNGKETFMGNTDKNRFYGLLAGKQSAAIDATAVKINVSDIEIVSNSINCNNFKDTTDDCGVGTIVGANYRSNLAVEGVIKAISIKVTGIPNLGSFVGYMENNSSNLKFKGTIDTSTFTISGTTNVGGLFGYLKGNVTTQSEEYLNLINTKFATIIVNGSSMNEYNNFGGLFGKWEGTNEFGTIKNANTIIIGTEGEAYNLGGIAGKIITNSITNLYNTGDIIETSGSGTFDVNGHLQEINGTVEDGDKLVSVTKPINVGGIFGYAENIDITEAYNTANISGYQNVGGLLGYANEVTLSNPSSTQLFGELYLDGVEFSRIKATDNLDVYYDLDDDKEFDEDDLIINELVTPSAENMSGNIYGVVNVGGVVGYAYGYNNNETQASITKVVTVANVYGNTNVGGLVGLSDQATLVRNYIIGNEESKMGIVKGVYYNYHYYKKVNGEDEPKTNSFIPTGVGGLVGTASNSIIVENAVGGVLVTSTEEKTSASNTEDGQNNITGGAVISTISNYMSDIALGEHNKSKFEQFTQPDKIYNLDKKSKLAFQDVTSGYGGLVGTIDTATLVNQTKVNDADCNIESNLLMQTNINAQLGINVGTYFGGYKFEASIDNKDEENGEETNVAFILPRLLGAINVDGAYNVGGIVGFVDGSASAFNINNAKIDGKAKIEIQNNITGIYVGGLIGKTNSNSISGLQIETGSAVGVNIQIHTNNCYNAGGLIGRAEVSSDATIEGNLGAWITNDDGKSELDPTKPNVDNIYGKEDDRLNFGGLIGMLKVGKAEDGLTIKVKGNHNMPFTINTIENTNYYDGDSRFNQDDNDSGVVLYAEAYYVNKDSFEIVGSQNTALYDNNEDENPIRDGALGWSKQYTGFRQLQRVIPKGTNKDKGYSGTKEWDSISVLFDAARITHVGTIKNLSLSEKEVETKDGSKVLPDDHICFTVYEQADGQATLYSAMGIASLMRETGENYVSAEKTDGKYIEGSDYYYKIDGYDQYFRAEVDKDGVISYRGPEGNDVLYVQSPIEYKTPVDDKPKWYEWVLGVITEQSPPQEYYIDALNNGDTIKGLTYFDWKNENYTTIGNPKGETSKTKFQNEPQAFKHMTYFIPEYFGTTGENGARYKGGDFGAYFQFDVVYENSSLSVGVGDELLPTSGSIFEVSGIYSPAADKEKKYGDNEDEFGNTVKTIRIISDIAITLITFGGAGLATAAGKSFVKGTASSIFEMMFKSGMQQIFNSVAKIGYKAFAASALVILARFSLQNALLFFADSTNSYANFIEPSNLNFGYLSSTYSRDITYKEKNGEVVLAQASDYQFILDGGLYYYYSNTRPTDYHINKYVGLEVEVDKIPGGDGERIKITSDTSKLINNGVYVPLGSTITNTYKVYVDDGTKTELVGVDMYGKVYLMSNKYEYKNGQYFISANAGEIETNPVTTGFNVEKDDFDADYSTPNYIISNNKYYVHGQFEDEAYMYKYDGTAEKEAYQYTDNLLVYSSGNYLINGVPISTETAEYNETQMRYSPKTKETALKKGFEGYDYFQNVYYTANGTKNLTVGDTNLVKYATFTYVGDQGDAISVEGTQGVDYIVQEYTYDGYKQSDNGDYLYIEKLNAHKEIRLEDRYDEFGEQSNSGKYLEVNGERYEITSANRFNFNPKCYGIFKLDVDTAMTDDDTNKTNFNEYRKFVKDDKVVVPVYPKTFTNPYANGTAPKDAKDSQYVWEYDPSAEGINFAPTYYVYEGGYTTADVETTDGKVIGYPLVYLPAEGDYTKTEINIQKYTTNANKEIQLTNGTFERITIAQLISDWNTKGYNKDWYSLTHEQPLDEVYQVVGGKLYIVNSMYTLDENGLLAKISLKPFNNDDSDIYENMYLTNSDYNLYTRYKYTYDGDILNLSGNHWSGYELIPSNTGSTMINSGRATRFVESARVILSGGKGVRIRPSGESYITEDSGTITIS